MSSASPAASSNWVEAYTVVSEALFLRIAIIFNIESQLWFLDIRRVFKAASSSELRPSTVGVRGLTTQDQLLALDAAIASLSKNRKSTSTASSLILARLGGKLSLKQRGAGGNHILLDIPSIRFLRRSLKDIIPLFPSFKPPTPEDLNDSWSESDEEKEVGDVGGEAQLDIEFIH